MGKMKARKKPVEHKSFLLPTLAEQLEARRPICQLAEKISSGDFEEESFVVTVKSGQATISGNTITVTVVVATDQAGNDS